MNREPGAKAQLISALVAALMYVLTKYLKLVPAEVDLLVPLVTYIAAQVVGWWWTRQLTTPVEDPKLPEGTTVTTIDVRTGQTTGTTTV